MAAEEFGQVTLLLQALGEGRQDAEAGLFPLVYDELRRLAGHYMVYERSDHTLQPTALVHEAYLRLTGQPIDWLGRGHFFAVAATAMRHILIDYARVRVAAKRGAGAVVISLDKAGELGTDESWTQLLSLHEALDRLALIDARQARVVELRFFSGLSIEETAKLLGVSGRTVKRDWEFAQAWLYLQVAPSE